MMAPGAGLWQRLFGNGRQTGRLVPPGGWEPSHRHRKGGLYRLLATGVQEADRSPVAIYDDEAGTIWVRDLAEFNDGRFTRV